MVKAHRHLVTHRIFRYKVKQLPYIIAKRINTYLPNAKEMLAFWLSFLDIIEKATLSILEEYGITGNEIVYWLAYAKKLVREGKVTNFLTILIEYQNVLDYIIKRNPNFSNYPEVLEKIQAQVTKEIGQHIHLWFGFYDLAYYDISIYLE
jgi:hypothetical protein